jgi:hypothetical protein
VRAGAAGAVGRAAAGSAASGDDDDDMAATLARRSDKPTGAVDGGPVCEPGGGTGRRP